MPASTKKDSPEWYQAAIKTLEEIEIHRAEYEDEEEGDVAPSDEIFASVRKFLAALITEDGPTLETPRMFVSPNGNIILTYGGKEKVLELRFSPDVFSSLKLKAQAEKNGKTMEDAVQFARAHFQV
jgi:hypothetical protein